MQNKTYFNSNDARSLINIHGFSLFPIHGVKEDGSCTCNNPQCSNIGKHPATPDGFKSASRDIEQVMRLWSGRKGLNVGVATGEKSGIFVIDIDSPEAEQDFYSQFNVPDTFTVTTGRGKHLYFKYDNNNPVKNGANIINGVDVRGDGGYVAGPGSNHSNGKKYEIVNQLEEFAQCPDDIMDFCINKKRDTPINELLGTPQQSNAPSFLKTSDGWTKEQIQDHLAHISPDIGYDEWIKVGMALHQEGAPFHLFDDWSRRGEKYDGTTLTHWNSFNANGGVSYGTIVAFAKAGGWKYQNLKDTHLLPEKIEVVNPETGEIKQPKKMYLINGNDIKYEPITTDFVQGVLTQGTMSVVYGESNCGKTFFMTDIAFHIAEGKRWRDRRVDKGSVVYVALEGINGLKGRIHAYRKEKEANLEHFHVMPSTFNFLDGEGDVTEFIRLLHDNRDTLKDLKLIVIDTLARAIGAGDENSGQDMGLLVQYADAIRAQTDAHICFVHHSGKDKAKGARGHSSLRAAVDTEIEIHREGDADYSTISVVKQRDLDKGEDMAFKLKTVEIGENEFLETQTSCVVEPYQPTEQKERVKLSDMQQFVYDAVVHAIMSHGRERNIKGHKLKSITYDDMREVLEERGFKEIKEMKDKTTAQQIKSTTQTVRVALQKKGKIGMDGTNIWLLSDDVLYDGRDD